ncbi:MAG: hypothetical protein OJF47_001565 [Nitrospira sp.]|nr:MAG: hypothetical protein OJF47_001565 [Nitrospira sp.]
MMRNRRIVITQACTPTRYRLDTFEHRKIDILDRHHVEANISSSRLFRYSQ